MNIWHTKKRNSGTLHLKTKMMSYCNNDIYGTFLPVIIIVIFQINTMEQNISIKSVTYLPPKMHSRVTSSSSNPIIGDGDLLSIKGAFNSASEIYWAATCDFQQYGILISVDSDEPVQPLFKLRNSKWCPVSSLTVIKYLSWSEPLLVAHTTLLEISCRGSIIIKKLFFK